MLGGWATLRADLAAHKVYQSTLCSTLRFYAIFQATLLRYILRNAFTLYSTQRFYAIFHATLRADLAAQQARLALLALHLGRRPINH